MQVDERIRRELGGQGRREAEDRARREAEEDRQRLQQQQRLQRPWQQGQIMNAFETTGLPLPVLPLLPPPPLPPLHPSVPLQLWPLRASLWWEVLPPQQQQQQPQPQRPARPVGCALLRTKAAAVWVEGKHGER